MDIIPTDLATYGEEAKNLLQDLQSRNERMFLVTVLVENIASKRQKLFNDIFAASGVAQKYNCALKRLDFQQEQGLMSSLALGQNQIEIERGLTTSSTAIFVPFILPLLIRISLIRRSRASCGSSLTNSIPYPLRRKRKSGTGQKPMWTRKPVRKPRKKCLMSGTS